LPQELCLSFECFSKEEEIAENSMIMGPPIEQVALEFGALLSTLTREPLVPLGIHRLDDRPVKHRGLYGAPLRHWPSGQTPAVGVNSGEVAEIINGLATAPEGDTRAVLLSAERYHSALSICRFDVSTAYLLLVSAIETLSGHHYKNVQDKLFSFDNVKKWEGARDLLAGLRVAPRNKKIIEAA